MLEALRRAVDRGARVLSVCSSAFALAAAGLLDGKRATAHWMHAGLLAERYPQVEVDPDVLYVDEDPVFTSAGTAAGIDLCLHLVRKEQGAEVANALARYDGGRTAPLGRAGPVRRHPGPRAPPPQHAGPGPRVGVGPPRRGPDGRAAGGPRAHVERTFTRRFRAATGTTPYAWVLQQQQRLLLAAAARGPTGSSMEDVAHRSGFGKAAAMRHHFVRERGTPPSAYRPTFRLGDARTAG